MHALPPITLVCAPTSRAYAYAEALADAGAQDVEITCYASPPADTPLAAIAARMGWRYTASDAKGIGEVPLPGNAAALSLFAGLPGEIVPAATLAAWPPMLHFHPGDLPAYRGSTTLFYALLQGDPVTVSALVLSPDIDAGPVLLKKRFAHPPRGDALNGPYDARIRAETLRELMEFWRRNGCLPQPLNCGTTQACMYYIIHPLLKHLALLRVPTEGSQP